MTRLKSLELHGYKTFASRTQFEYPGPITAIVGPNGSGKSNIADSMRWVLGEQSFLLLRGRKTEDMIFSGSEFRPRAGMASATITFDNSDGWLPIDFSEVSITRRAYRDGQNEYLLNGQKVRLREISELLAQSGLAERTYTIIGQGLVDAALALKPEERRRLFEEAAGIGLYRGRREEAITRLENTRRNLERVQDILAELEPRLKSLEKQAKRAQEYERIRADLNLLLRDWYGYHWHRQQQELAHAMEVLRAQEARLEQAREREQAATAEVAALRGKIATLRTQLNEYNAQAARLHQEREQHGRALAVAAERQRSLAEQKQQAELERVRLEEEGQALRERLQQAVQERERLQAEQREAREQVDRAKKALLQRQLERGKVEQELREARQRASALENRLVQLRAHQTELANRIARDRKALEDLAAGSQRANVEAEAAQKAFEQQQAARAELETARTAAQEALGALRKELAALEAERRRAVDQRSQSEAHKAGLQAQLNVLEQAELSFTGLGTGARYLLQAQRQGKLNGPLRSLSQALDVPPEFEAAISAALGESLDLVLFSGEEGLDAALRLLETGAQGRAAMLPIAWARADCSWPVPEDGELIGRACDVIGAESQLSGALQAVLGSTLIARTRAAARRLARQVPTYVRIVTLEGEIFSAAGPVIAGREQPANGRTAGVLARGRQKRELQAQLAEQEQAAEAARAAVRAAEAALQERQAALAEQEKALRQLSTRQEALNEALHQARLRRDQAQRQVEWQANQHKQLESQIQRSQAEAGQVGKEIGDVDARLTAQRETTREISARLASLGMDELQNQLAHWNTSAALADRGARDSEARAAELEQRCAQTAQRARGQAARLAELDIQRDTLERERAASLAAEAALAAQVEAVQQALEPAAQALGALEKEYEQLQQVEDSAKQALTVAERYYTQAMLDHSRQREGVETLRRRVEEDFGLVEFEFAADVPGQETLPLEGMVQQLPVLTEVPENLDDTIARQRAQLRRMGAINPDALTEYEGVLERFQFMTTQVSDLNKADADLRQVIDELDELMRRQFRKTFEAVAGEFKHLFTRLFGGGSARLILSDDEHPTEAGIDIEARLPGRREQGLSLLSGGERSLTAVALIFSLLKVSPTPFCIMDEVDAMLDEANVGRFRDLLAELSQTTQFIVITHNRNTVQAADVIYGVTMGKDSSSQVISLRLEDVPEEMAA